MEECRLHPSYTFSFHCIFYDSRIWPLLTPQTPLTQCSILLLHVAAMKESQDQKQLHLEGCTFHPTPHHRKFFPGWIVLQCLPGSLLLARSSTSIYRLSSELCNSLHILLFFSLLSGLPTKSQNSSFSTVQMNSILTCT